MSSRVELFLVGPEMSHSAVLTAVQTHEQQQQQENDVITSPRFYAGQHRGGVREFFRQHSEYLHPRRDGRPVVVVGLNCGFGNWENPMPMRYDLFFSFIPDLYFLSATMIPLIFTCANDFADVVGETGVVQALLGSRYLSPPQENPFSFASTMVPPQQQQQQRRPEQDGEVANYSRGNAFWYAVQGHDRGRRLVMQFPTETAQLKTKSIVSLMTRLQAVPLQEFSALTRPIDCSSWARAPAAAAAAAAAPLSSSLSEASTSSSSTGETSDRAKPVVTTTTTTTTTSSTVFDAALARDTDVQHDESEDAHRYAAAPLSSSAPASASASSSTLSRHLDVQQEVDHERQRSRVVISGIASAEAAKAADFSVSDDGARLRLRLRLSGHHGGHHGDGDSTEELEISLENAVVPSSVRAKYSSKRCQLTIEGDVAKAHEHDRARAHANR